MASVYRSEPEPFEGCEHYDGDNPWLEDGWQLPEVGIEAIHVHPIHICGEEHFTIVDAAAFLSGGMGVGPFPESGGYLDQASATMTAIAIALGAKRDIEDYRKSRKRR